MAFVNAAGNANNNTAALVVNYAPSAGSVLVAAMSWDGGDTLTNSTLPSGFTLIDRKRGTGDGQCVSVGYKVATGSETNFSFSGDGANTKDICACVLEFSGRDTTTPLDVAGVTWNLDNAKTASPVTVNATGVTVATNGADLVWLGAGDSSSAGAYSCAAPSTFTEATDNASGTWSSLSSAYKNNVSTGATGTIGGTYTTPGTSGKLGILIALKPAGGSSNVNLLAGKFGALLRGKF